MKREAVIKVSRIDHLTLRAVELPRLLAFYRDVLGFRVAHRDDVAGVVQLTSGTALIDLVDANGPVGRRSGPAATGSARNMDHLCLMLDDFDAAVLRTELGAHGVQLSAPIERGASQSLYLYDPEGNQIELKGVPTPARA
ncbi:MAG TPA: VOC family protein [Nevskiaceae bacterium]|nr:VOC family protein [Nevskiaceae bacterium]